MRQCLFCDSEASSGEDIWPLWLLRHFDAPRGVSVSLERGANLLPTWKRAKHGHKVRFICTACNNGWMSDLENRTKPVLERLLSDDPTVLELAHQATLARWAVKGAMVFEALREGQAFFYTAEDRSALKNDSVMPNRTVIWLAKCVDLPGIYVNASDHSDTPDHSTDGVRFYSTTMGFGHVAIQIGTMKLPASVPDTAPITLDVLDGPWEQAMLALRESGPAVQWPATIGLNGELGLQSLASRWFTTTAG